MRQIALLDMPDDILELIYLYGVERRRNTALRNPEWLRKSGTKGRCQFSRRFSSVCRRFLYLKKWPIVVFPSNNKLDLGGIAYTTAIYGQIGRALPCWSFEISRQISPKAYFGSNYSSDVRRVVEQTTEDIITHNAVGKVGCLHICVTVPASNRDWQNCEKDKLETLMKGSSMGSGINCFWIFISYFYG